MVATAIGSYATTAALKALIGTTDSDDDSLLGTICDRVNQHIETETRQPICPIGSRTYLYDIPDTTRRGLGTSRIFAPMPVDAPTKGIGGLRAVTLVEYGGYSGATYSTLASTDYFLRERKGVIGPYQWLCFSDRPLGSYSSFATGRATIRVTGTAGWDAIPDDLTQVALLIAQKMWNARAVGREPTEDGLPPVAAMTTNLERGTMWNYRLRMPF